MVTLERGLGYIPDEPSRVERDEEQWHAAKLLGAVRTGTRRSNSVLAHAHGYRLDQGGANSCVAFALNMACYIGAASHGAPIVLPSFLWTYLVGRLNGAGWDEPLVDLGCNPGRCTDGLTGRGIAAETRFAYDPSRVNEGPPFDLRQAASDALLSGYYVIPSGDASIEMLKHAVDSGFAVAFGGPVDAAYMQLRGSDWWPGCEGESKGDHMILATGYDDARGVETLGSYGREHGADGVVWMPFDWFASPRVSGRLVPTAIPKVIT